MRGRSARRALARGLVAAVVAAVVAAALGCEAPADEPAPAVEGARLVVERLPADDPHARAYPIDFELAAVTGRPVPGGEVQVAVRLRAQPGWHIYGPEEEGFAPTFFRAAAEAPARLVGIAWPPLVRFPIDDFTTTAVFESGAAFTLRLRLSEDLVPGSRAVIPLEVGFGACDDESCLAPQEWRLRVELDVAGGSAAPAAPAPGGG